MKVDDARTALQASLRTKIAGKAKPPGSLGRLEDLAVQIGVATRSLTPALGQARLLIFAGDHGLTAEGISAYPSQLTVEIVKLVLQGKAGANICAAGSGTEVIVVDSGMLSPLADQPGLLSRRVAPGTRNARKGPAMTLAEYQQAFDTGEKIVKTLIGKGVGIFALGEIAIGNSSAAALLAHAATNIPLATLVGPGAGPADKGQEHKKKVLAETYARGFGTTVDCDPRHTFLEFAGFEMVMMAGAIAAITEAGKIAIIDGFVGSSVAAAVFALIPQTKDHCVFSQFSGEPGHKALLARLGVTPLLDLGLRLGEGTGAVLAVPMVRAAELMLTTMAELPNPPVVPEPAPAPG